MSGMNSDTFRNLKRGDQIAPVMLSGSGVTGSIVIANEEGKVTLFACQEVRTTDGLIRMNSSGRQLPQIGISLVGQGEILLNSLSADEPETVVLKAKRDETVYGARMFTIAEKDAAEWRLVGTFERLPD